MTPEGKVKKAVAAELKARGIWYFMPVSNGMGKVGIPDFICCHHGQFLAIETKAPGKTGATTPNQKLRIREISESGGMAIVIDDVITLINLLGARDA